MPEDDATTPINTADRLTRSDREKLRTIIHGSMSAEFATARGEKPATFPLTPFYDDARGSIVVTSPVAYAAKANAVRKNPRVSLLLHDENGEYLVTGDAQVYDDIEANATYVRKLTAGEPQTPKREANEEKYEFVDTRVGNALMGWINDRVVIEVDPLTMTRVGKSQSTPAVPAWSAVDMNDSEARQYERAVLTVVGPDGYPVTQPVTSIRLADDAAVVEPQPTPLPPDGQPACLLVHWHDEASIYLGQRVVRGRFSIEDETARLVPASSSTLRNDGLVHTLRFLVEGRRRTRAYFAKRPASAVVENGTTPPGPDGVPVLGNTIQFLRDPIRFYQQLSGYGDVIRYRVGWNTWTALLHPDAIERVLVSESDRFTRYNFEELGFDFITDGLFFSDGEQWRRQRQLIQPAFAPANVAAFSETIISETVETVDEWGEGETVAANQVFSDLTLEVLTTTLFDVDLDDRREVVTDAAHALAARVDTQSLSAVLPGWIPTRRNRDFARKMARFDATVAELIHERRADDTPRDDLLSTLLEHSAPAPLDGSDEPGTESETDDHDYSFTDDELRDQLTTFLFAGHETSALVLTYASFVLAKHESIRGKLEAELDAVCGDRLPTVEDVPDLTFTDQLLKETMRYYPPIYVLFREAREDVTVDDYLIPEGTKLALPQFILHADERWWDDPDEFRPERWADDQMADRPEYAYFPFGGGPRHCVGMRFAMMFLTLSLATMARLVRFDLESDPDPDLRMAATLSPASDVELTVRKQG